MCLCMNTVEYLEPLLHIINIWRKKQIRSAPFIHLKKYIIFSVKVTFAHYENMLKKIEVEIEKESSSPKRKHLLLVKYVSLSFFYLLRIPLFICFT